MTMEALHCRNVTGLTVSVSVVPTVAAAAAAAGEVRAPRGRAVMIAMSRHVGAYCGVAAQGQRLFNKLALSRTQEWRAYSAKAGLSSDHRSEDSASTGVHATVEKANNTENSTNVQRFGTSESLSDDGSSLLAVESVLETEGGNSVEDYKLRADIFSESAVFFAALKDRNNGVSQ